MSILFLIGLTIALILILITLILLFLEDLCVFVTEKRECCREFIIKNAGFFTILFILLFSFEQLVLIIILTYFFEVSKWISAVVGIFALIVVTTSAFEKFVWQYKYQWSEDIRNSAESAGSTIEEQRELIKSFVNKIKPTKSKKE